VSAAPLHRLRVLKIVGSLELAGTERYIVRVAPLLRSFGIDVEICLLDRRGQLIEAAEAAGIRVHGTQARSRRSRTLVFAGLATVLEIASLIHRGRFDIVHSYLFHAEIVGTPAARLARVPRIIVSRRGVYPWRRPRGAPYFVLETATNMLANELIANSDFVLHDAERTERLLPKTRTVIHNGVDARQYALASPTTAGTLRLVTVGALAPAKGQIYAIEALRLVRDAGIDAQLTLVGGGGDESPLRRASNEFHVDRSVVFAGPQMDPRPFLLDADIFVLPSRAEGFSNALLEAMASGLPVVVTDVGGNREAVGEGEGSLIVPPVDSAALAQAILKLARSRDALVTMGQANRQRVEAVFSLDGSVRRLADWYRRSSGVIAAEEMS
jgi:glycosyltransferase involved in cell wall biosynthesis